MKETRHLRQHPRRSLEGRLAGRGPKGGERRATMGNTEGPGGRSGAEVEEARWGKGTSARGERGAGTAGRQRARDAGPYLQVGSPALHAPHHDVGRGHAAAGREPEAHVAAGAHLQAEGERAAAAAPQQAVGGRAVQHRDVRVPPRRGRILPPRSAARGTGRAWERARPAARRRDGAVTPPRRGPAPSGQRPAAALCPLPPRRQHLRPSADGGWLCSVRGRRYGAAPGGHGRQVASALAESRSYAAGVKAKSRCWTSERV